MDKRNGDKKNKTFTSIDVWQGKKNKLNLYLKHDIYKTIPKSKKKYLEAKVVYEGPIQAPINKDEVIAKLKISYKGKNIGTYNLLSIENVKRQNIISRLITSINFLIWGDV